MADTEKVIKALENYEPYAKVFTNLTVEGWVVCDALELLKEKEAVKPRPRNPHQGAWWYECGNCNTAISPGDKYCRGCGRAIDWSK